MNYALFASESVASGHPDKICDQVSDAIVDAVLAKDPHGRIGVECLATHEHFTIAGEVTSTAIVDYETIARDTIRFLGYTDEAYNFWDNSPVHLLIHEQSADISRGVNTGGAGDQGMMFGYACNETKAYMPLPIYLAHSLVYGMDQVRITRRLPFLKPDGKSEVVVCYENGMPKSIERIILAVPHDDQITPDELKLLLYDMVVMPVLIRNGYDIDYQSVIVNGTGAWNTGGPSSDSGLTGRKIIVDTYGGMGRHGGGCFSGKDPTKVDRSGAYAARYIAKNIVASGMAERCEVAIAYVIGHTCPVSRSLDTFGTAQVNKKQIEEFAWDLLDLSVNGIISSLDLRRPIYARTAAYGHFGRACFPWEKVVV
ncbi:MAG TPA: methionine adenosyltransferase [bacterium]|nr:methionine adenosyltransferase [bacterium]